MQRGANLHSRPMPSPFSVRRHPGFLTLALAIALVASLLLKFWLASRQIRHVAQHRDAVPPDFAASVPLAAHQSCCHHRPRPLWPSQLLFSAAL